MSTMSYCCMENVSQDMDVCLKVMNQSETLEDIGDRNEISSCKLLYNKCQLFVEEYERLTQK